jgi:hypothetical protein
MPLAEGEGRPWARLSKAKSGASMARKHLNMSKGLMSASLIVIADIGNIGKARIAPVELPTLQPELK